MINQFLMRLEAMAASLFMAVLVAAAGMAFLAGAAYLALLTAVPPPLAALVTGIGTLAFAVLILLVGRHLSRGRRLLVRRRRSSDGGRDVDGADENTAEIGGLLGAQIGSLVRSHTPSTLAISLLAGFAVGASPRLRKALLDIVIPR